MMLRHAAALALAGWYLIVPPFTNSWYRDIWRWWTGSNSMALTRVLDKECTLDAPFSEWEQSNEYQSLSVCQADQTRASVTKRREIDEFEKSLEAAQSPSPPLPMTEKQKAIEESYRQSQEREIECAGHARCAASDDPRLAK
jgi:hypothetical protein